MRRLATDRINPFLLQFEVNNFALPGHDGQRLLGFDRLFVDFEAASLWRRAYVFKDIEIAAPYANALIAQNGELNFDALKPKAPAAPPAAAEPKGPLPRIEIGLFRLLRGAASYEDHSRRDPIRPGCRSDQFRTGRFHHRRRGRALQLLRRFQARRPPRMAGAFFPATAGLGWSIQDR